MATLQSELPLRNLNASSYFLAILLAIFLQIVTAGSAFSDGGHGGAPIAGPQGPTIPCALRLQATRFLKQQGFLTRGGGQFAETMLAELWVNGSTGKWVWTVTGPDGITCIMLEGQSWGGGI